jgi:uncharacterized protein YbaP (TraB family)
MKIIGYLCFCIFVLAGCNSASRPKYKAIPLDNSLLWQISGNGLSAPCYLFGIDHLIGGNFLDTLPYVMEKFRQCKAVATEADLESEPDEYKLHIVLKNDSLSHLFTPVEFAEISKALAPYGRWQYKTLDRLKPAYIYDYLFAAVVARTASKTNHHLDKYFREAGRVMGYKIIGLESVAFHDSLLFDSPLAIQKTNLLYLVRHIDQARKLREQSFKLYHQQDLNGMEKHESLKNGYTDKYLYQYVASRNSNWLRELPVIMKGQPTFIAVGAAHLLWDCGLINQLRQNGYMVTAVTN